MRSLEDETIIEKLRTAYNKGEISSYVYDYCVRAIEERTTMVIEKCLEKYPNYMDWGKKVVYK